MSGVEVRVDAALCEEHGFCVEVAPEVFDWSDEGPAAAVEGPVPDGAESGVRDAVNMCPVRAIVLRG